MTEDKIKAAAEIYCDKPYNTSLEKQQAYRAFLNGALSPETKEHWQQGMYTEEDMNKAFDLGFKWSKTDKSEGPLSFLWRMFNQDKKK